MPTPRQGYYLADGTTRVPSVTTITGRFKDSGGLIHWAWSQGRDGKDFREERDIAADAGTLAHALVEAHVRGQDPEPLLVSAEPAIRRQGEQGYQNWLVWAEQTKIIVEPWETPVVCEHYRYGGTPDAVLYLDGKAALGDWKTGGTYVDHLMQLAAYGHLLEDHNVHIQGGYHLCRFSREAGDFSHHYYGELSDAWEMFLLLRKAYDLDSILKRRVR